MSGYYDPNRPRRVAAPIASAMIDRPDPNLGNQPDAVPAIAPPQIQAMVAPQIRVAAPPAPGMDGYELNRGTMASAPPPVQATVQPLIGAGGSLLGGGAGIDAALTNGEPGSTPIGQLVDQEARGMEAPTGMGAERGRSAEGVGIAPPMLVGSGGRLSDQMGATPGYSTPEAIARDVVPDENQGFKARLGRGLLNSLSGGGAAIAGELTGEASRARVDQKRGVKAAEYRGQRQEARQADEDTFNHDYRQQQLELNKQTIEARNRPEYAATDIGEGQVYTYDKNTGDGKITGSLRAPKPTARKWEKGYDKSGNEFEYDPEDPDTTRRPTGGVYGGMLNSENKSDPLSGYTARPLDEHMRDATGLDARGAQDQLSQYDQQITGLDQQIAAKAALGDDDDAKAERQALEQRRDNLRSERNDLMGRVSGARSKFNEDQLRQREHPARQPRQSSTSSGVAAPTYYSDAGAAKQELIRRFGSWEKVPAEKKTEYNAIVSRK